MKLNSLYIKICLIKCNRYRLYYYQDRNEKHCYLDQYIFVDTIKFVFNLPL